MVLPIAILLDDEGLVMGFRCLEYSFDASGKPLTKVIERTEGNLVYTRFNFSLHLGYIFPNLVGLTYVNREGVVGVDYTQVLLPESESKQDYIHAARDKVFYVVDYKGNVAEMSFHTLYDMQHKGKLKLGNIGIEAHSPEHYTIPEQSLTIPVCNYDGNLYRKQLEIQSVIGNYDTPLTDAFKLSHFQEGTVQGLIPKGVQDIMLNSNYEKTPPTLSSIFCKPSLIRIFRMTLYECNLDTVVCPKYIFSNFTLVAKSIKNLTLPSYIMPYGHEGANSFWLDIGYYPADTLTLPTMLIDDLNLSINNSPELKSLDITLAYFNSYNHTEFTYNISLFSAPKLREINFRLWDKLKLKGQIDMLRISVKSSDITINLPEVKVKRLYVHISSDIVGGFVQIRQSAVDTVVVYKGNKVLQDSGDYKCWIDLKPKKRIEKVLKDNNTVIIENI